MMNSKVVFVLAMAIVALANNALSLECPTCKGAECSSSEIYSEKCSREVAALPFGFEIKSLNDGAEKLGCVSLEYLIEPEVQYSLRQCYLIPDSNLCESISGSLPSSVVMTSCEFHSEDEVQSYVSRLYKRDVEQMAEVNSTATTIEGSADGSSEAPTQAPTAAPTQAPTEAPTQGPSEAQTEAPTQAPTAAPTEGQSSASTEGSTQAPTEGSSSAPTEGPTEAPGETTTTSPDDGGVAGIAMSISVLLIACLVQSLV